VVTPHGQALALVFFEVAAADDRPAGVAARLMTSSSSVAPGTMLIRSSNSASFPTLCSRHTATTS
jgi:hypothetical protein